MNGKCCLSCGTVLAVLLLAVSSPAAADESMRARANSILGIEDSRIISIDVDRTPGIGQTVTFVDGDERITLVLSPHSVRGKNYQLLLQQADGAIVESESAPITPVRGKVRASTGDVVGIVTEQGLFASIEMAGRERQWIEPLSGLVPGASLTDHVIYNESDVVAGGGSCAAGVVDASFALTLGEGGGCEGDPCIAEMVVDADFEYFSEWGADTEARILLVINTVNVQFERDVGITHTISALMIRTAEPDPYTSTDCLELQQQFRAEWLNNHPEIPRDLAQLFTGKELDDGIITCTSVLGTVCTDDAFGVIQSDAVGSLQCITDLHAHELGHMWGASHCSCPSHTMNPALTCSNAFNPDQTVPDIIAFRDSVDCLEPAGGPPEIVHSGIGGETFPSTGFIDPAVESSNGTDLDLGHRSVDIRFTAAMSDCGGGPLTAGNIVMSETGVATPPNVTGVSTIDGDDSFIRVDWDRPITLQQWTTITVVNACDSDGTPLLNLGDLGEGNNEPDRIDLAFLPSDVDPNGQIQPLDLLAFRLLINQCGGGPICDPEVQPRIDLDRNTLVTPFDLLMIRRLFLGLSPATQPWAFKALLAEQP